MADDDKNDEKRDDTGGDAKEGPDADDLDAPVDDDKAESDGDDTDESDDDSDDAPNTSRTKSDDDDDDDLVDDDDVEADLDRILKDRMVTVEDEEAEADEPSDRSDGGERLQPKQRDEQLCSSCFLLVRSNAPNCPVGDDDCPIFS